MRRSDTPEASGCFGRAVRDNRDIGEVTCRRRSALGIQSLLDVIPPWPGFFVRSTHQPNNERRSAVLAPDEAAFGFLVLTDDRSNEDHMRVEAGMHLWVDLVDRFEAAGDNGFPADDGDLLACR